MYILNEKNIQPLRGLKRERLSCVSDATSPILHHIDARASNARIKYKLPLRQQPCRPQVTVLRARYELTTNFSLLSDITSSHLTWPFTLPGNTQKSSSVFITHHSS
ncbi:hypothetical protein Y032_0608g605 [Ancylostoma ceylanicum]|nr:hypothetical protein Y032_0608g605 [Ancylostoma ceylanicum]